VNRAEVLRQACTTPAANDAAAAADAARLAGAAAAVDVEARIEAAWRALEQVADPEIPVVSICELGIVRDVALAGDAIQVVLTPTYSGCPATEAIEADVRGALDRAGLSPVAVQLQRAPAWTTEWISDEGRRKLREYGIAPPGAVDASRGVSMRFVPRRAPAPVDCPRCGSAATECLSAFGSTACKALYRCRACGEPFEHFKPI
jgi:ring-1,2-phenylacetyl-CoA epoxidase subunit PaaD